MAVAWELFQIFCTQGFPLILQCDNGKAFCEKVIERLKMLWPDCIIVQGRSLNPQTQESKARVIEDINKMVGGWMKRHSSSHWSIGIYNIAYDKNNRWNKSIGACPFDLHFGQMKRTALDRLPVDKALLTALSTWNEHFVAQLSRTWRLTILWMMTYQKKGKTMKKMKTRTLLHLRLA